MLMFQRKKFNLIELIERICDETKRENKNTLFC